MRLVLIIGSFWCITQGYQVLHLADFHLDLQYSKNGNNQKMCHDDGLKRNETLGEFGDYMCDAPKPLVQHAIEESARLFPKPDLILWTGDNVAHIDGYDWELVVDNINQTTSLLFAAFPPTTTILPTFGNHDYAPANGFISNSSLYSKTWQMWKSKIGDENEATFMRGGFYKYRLPNATAVVLNTNLYYNANKAYDNFTCKEDPAGQFAFLENELITAERCANRVNANCTSLVHIIAHIGPGVFERTANFTWFRPEYNQHFLDLTIRYANSIGWMFFGHHHTDTFHLIKDSKDNVVQVALMAPAVTPWFSSLDGAGANNPTFRIYNTDSYSNIIDIETYYIDLNDLNKNSTTPFVFEYSFKDAYEIQGFINADSLSKVVDRIKTNDTVLQKYINFNSAFWKPVIPTGIYRGAQLCSLEFSDYPRYYSCLAEYSKSAMSAKISLPIFSIIAILYNELDGFL